MATSNTVIGADTGLVRPAARRRQFYRHFTTLTAAGAWTYALAIPIVFGYYQLQPSQLQAIAPWIALPLQGLAMVSICWLLFDRSLAPGAMRRFWWLMLAFAALNTLANYLWNIPRSDPGHEELDVYDVMYLIDYGILTAAFALMFVRTGGALRSPRVWLDGATMITVQLVALWSFFLAPDLPRKLGHDITMGATLSYSLVLVIMMSMAALLCIQLPRYSGRAGILLIVGAALAETAWEIIWLGSWLVDFEFIGPYYNYGDVLCFACISTAVCFAHDGSPPAAATANSDSRGDGFLPALALLVAIGMVAGTLATTKRIETWLLVVLVSLCALLLVTRQHRVRAELRALTQQLAAREADARLTELVRRSSDLIIVVDPAGLVSFASPSARSMLWLFADELKGIPAVSLFGSSNESAIRNLLEAEMNGGHASDAIEIHFERPPGNTRIYKLAAVNQLANPVINGIVLTAHEVTGQRELEREVLDAATRERVRMSGAIHEGLGQELTGIALLLHGAAKTPSPDPQQQRRQLMDIVERVNQSIVTARNLAGGLSPLRVARGSLVGALQGLIQTPSGAMQIHLHIEPQFKDEWIDGFSADHLYRIVQEALDNALRHSSGTRVDIHLGTTPSRLYLRVVDDGKGLSGARPAGGGWGLRLMEYRVRLLAGTLRAFSSHDPGTRVEVVIPLPIARPPGSAA